MTESYSVNAPAGPSVGTALQRALVSQFHPKMLLALFLPVFIALLGAIVLLWFFYAPLNSWLEQFFATGPVNQLDQWLLAAGLFSLTSGIVPVLAIFILLPLAGIAGLIIAAVFIMPIVLAHLGKRNYPEVKKCGQYANTTGAFNAAWVGLVFVLGWVVTLPLWLFPPLALVLPVFWWAFAFNRMLRVDALVEHASISERKWLWRRYNRQYWVLGLIMALGNLLPPLWLVLPVFSALAFAHFSLDALGHLRSGALVDAPHNKGPQPG